MPKVQLEDRAIIAVSGTAAESFLQNIVTCDLDGLGPKEARPCALLSPQGKILFDFLVSRLDSETLLLECRADIADDLVRRLMLYRLRAKADISKWNQTPVVVSWGKDSAASQSESTGIRDMRFPASANVWRSYGPGMASAGVDSWTSLRIENGVAESGDDYGLADAFPHDVLLDELGGVGFRKGCYVGQEVVSRMQHRGTARRRVLIVSGERELPPTGTDITVKNRVIGSLGSIMGTMGLAIIRIDRAKDALDAGIDILAGEVAVSVAIPAFAKFTYPENSGAAPDG